MADLKVTIPRNSQNIEGMVTIKAPLDRVFEAHTNEKLFGQWWCRGNPLTVHRFDCRDGGFWHITEHSEDDQSHEFLGCFHEVTPNVRIVQTFEYMGLPERGSVLLERMDFSAIDAGSTQIRTLSTAQSQADRDGMVDVGMEEGWRQSIEALGALLKTA